jgi:hypothetical protein
VHAARGVKGSARLQLGHRPGSCVAEESYIDPTIVGRRGVVSGLNPVPEPSYRLVQEIQPGQEQPAHEPFISRTMPAEMPLTGLSFERSRNSNGVSFDDAVGPRPRGLPPAPRANPVGRLVSREHVADAGDAAFFAADHGEPFQREGRTSTVSQKMLEPFSAPVGPRGFSHKNWIRILGGQTFSAPESVLHVRGTCSRPACPRWQPAGWHRQAPVVVRMTGLTRSLTRHESYIRKGSDSSRARRLSCLPRRNCIVGG